MFHLFFSCFIFLFFDFPCDGQVFYNRGAWLFFFVGNGPEYGFCRENTLGYLEKGCLRGKLGGIGFSISIIFRLKGKGVHGSGTLFCVIVKVGGG